LPAIVRPQTDNKRRRQDASGPSVVRLQKFLAESGVASRRASEALICEGKVSVNGRLVRELGTKVDPARDSVIVSGQVVRPRRKMYVAVHKPRGCVVTRNDPEGRPTVFNFVPVEWAHLYPVGRLDYDSEGLILLTNDGDFALRVTHPRYGVTKRYEVTVEGKVGPAVERDLVRGVMDEGERLKARSARVLSASNKQSVLQLELSEGKNREIRRLAATLGLKVRRLARNQIGPIKLGQLRPGKWRTLTETEIKTLLGPL
jgi:23S rRNA pseudouridine2605 synthase